MLVAAAAVRGVLFLSKTLAFAQVSLGTSIALNANRQPRRRLNFKVTLGLYCDYASVDVWDTLGTDQQKATRNVEKWKLDKGVQRRIFLGRNQ